MNSNSAQLYQISTLDNPAYRRLAAEHIHSALQDGAAPYVTVNEEGNNSLEFKKEVWESDSVLTETVYYFYEGRLRKIYKVSMLNVHGIMHYVLRITDMVLGNEEASSVQEHEIIVRSDSYRYEDDQDS